MRALIVLGAAVTVLAFASPAQAAPLGTLTLSQTSGSVTDPVMFTAATTSAACPAGYGTNAALKVGKVGGPYNNLQKIQSAGHYDAAPVTIGASRSFMVSNENAPPAPGAYEVVVVCTSDTAGDHPDLFVAHITVTGSTWKVDGTQPAAAQPTAAPQVNADVASPTPTGTPGPTRAGGPLPTTGTSVGPLLPAGLVLLGAGAGAVWVVRRRRRAA
ncbi:hypothetical protein Lfu02_55910 [Longispora fulva]|uniref:LPXTG-motif cell wall-anchored protein n=1 Tax=Longispora fulva TaxID=619741 RepID=A0A8J7GGE1_9ACTN|nr:LPXTG cell wall anchor domain-containing protein [Longispora fulva]MBG6137426.1 LPXTG-motif cell wall-anchored protein [Longispora fulva]GIG61219.1 hypothetical protein Lfu02_55910 [Longispora fulva]